MRKSSKKQLLSLRDEVLAGIDRPVPREPAAIMAALQAFASRRAGRDVEVRFMSFPPLTVSGLLLETGERTIIVVEESTNAMHQLLIFAHELGHHLMGHCSDHDGDPTPQLQTAARAIGSSFDAAEAAVLAARTSFGRKKEHDAELFAVLLTTAFQEHIALAPCAPREGLAGRLQASLGYRGRGLDYR